MMYCRRGLFRYLACQVRTQPSAPDCSSWTVRHGKNVRASEWKDNEQVRTIRTLVDEMVINGPDMNRRRKGCSKHFGNEQRGDLARACGRSVGMHDLERDESSRPFLVACEQTSLRSLVYAPPCGAFGQSNPQWTRDGTRRAGSLRRLRCLLVETGGNDGVSS